MTSKSISDPTTWVTGIIQHFCDGPENSLQDGTGERAWDTPIVGFANGADPIFEQYKEVVGPFHWTPLEIFTATYPDVEVDTRRTHRHLLHPAANRSHQTRPSPRRLLPRRALGAIAHLRRAVQRQAAPPRRRDADRSRLSRRRAVIGAGVQSPRLGSNTSGLRRGPNATPPTPLDSAPSASATASSRPWAKRCAPAPSSRASPSRRRPAPTMITAPTASGTRKARAARASSAVRWARSPKTGTTSASAAPTSKSPEPTSQKTTASKATAAACARSACRANQAFPKRINQANSTT